MTRARRKISLFFHCAAAQLKSLLSSSCEYYLFLPHKSANYQIWRSSEPKKSFRVWLKSGPNFMQWMDLCLSTKLTWIEVELKTEVRSSNPANGKLFHCQLYWNDKNTEECGNGPNFLSKTNKVWIHLLLIYPHFSHFISTQWSASIKGSVRTTKTSFSTVCGLRWNGISSKNIENHL